MAKARSQYRCSECHHITAKWVGRCPDCGTWGTVDEVAVLAAVNGSAPGAPSPPRRPPCRSARSTPAHPPPPHRRQRARPRARRRARARVGDAAGRRSRRRQVDPAARGRAQLGRGPASARCTVSGEESAAQIRLRAERTGCTARRALPGRRDRPADGRSATSTRCGPSLRGRRLGADHVAPPRPTACTGGVTQVRAVDHRADRAAKERGVAVMLVGHVTKDGADRRAARRWSTSSTSSCTSRATAHSSLRMVRGVKNRFGAADEVGCFQLHDNGIECVADPSRAVPAISGPSRCPGTAVTVTLDGKRPLIGEVQALIGAPANGLAAAGGQRHRLVPRRDDHRGAGEARQRCPSAPTTSTCRRSAACG